MLFFKKVFYLNFLGYYQNLSFLLKHQYNFCLLNLLMLILKQNFLELTSLTILSNSSYFLTTSLLYFSKVLKQLALFKFSITNLSSSDFKFAKSTFLANFNVSTPVEFIKSAFLHN